MPTICGAPVFVRITTDSGAVGIGETYAGVKAPLVAKAIVEVLAPTIIGEEALAIQRLWRKLVDATHWTQNGIGMGGHQRDRDGALGLEGQAPRRAGV